MVMRVCVVSCGKERGAVMEKVSVHLGGLDSSVRCREVRPRTEGGEWQLLVYFPSQFK